MIRLKALSIILLILLPLITILASLSMGNLGFFAYSFPGAVAPGLTCLLIHYFGRTPAKS